MKKLPLLAHQILIHYIILSERDKYRMIKEASLSVSFMGIFRVLNQSRETEVNSL